MSREGEAVPNRVPASTYERAVSELRDEFQGFSMLDSLQAYNPRAAIGALAAREELPPDE